MTTRRPRRSEKAHAKPEDAPLWRRLLSGRLPQRPHALIRRLFGRIAPTAAARLCVTTLLLILELVIAGLAHLPMPPFLLCVAGFLVLVCFTASRPSNSGALRFSRILTVVALLKALAVFVGVTGGVASPFLGVLYLPIFLGCLYYGLYGGLSCAAVVCLFLWQLTLWQPGHDAELYRLLWIQCGVFALVSGSAALFAERMRHTALVARRNASAQARLVKQGEWFVDTEIMLQSLDDLPVILAVIMMRLKDLVTFDTAGIYLREPDALQLQLTETEGVNARRVPVKTVSMSRLDDLRDPEFEVLAVANTDTCDEPVYRNFATFDPDARSAILVPLKTLEDVFGVVCIFSHRVDAFRVADIRNMAKAARHIGYPIQRVRLLAMAATDALTGLNNSRAFRTRLRDEVERANRYGHPLALVMLDIDRFKAVNDELGHRAGDAILTQVGSLIRRLTRGIDFPARYGGEELAVICPDANEMEAWQLAERIRAAVERYAFVLPEGGVRGITLSAGVAMIAPARDTAAALIEAADQALYRAKSGGRNRVMTASG